MQNGYHPTHQPPVYVQQQQGQPGYGYPQQPQQFAQRQHQGQPMYPPQGQPMYPPQGQPMYPQMQQGQPMYPPQGQPMFANRPMNAFGVPQQDQTQPNMAANTRYGGNNKPQEQQQYVTTEVEAPIVKVEKEQIPLTGNEYPFLLANNLTLEKQNLGGYFKYIIKGNIMDNKEVSLKIMDVSDEDMVLSQDAICDGFNKSSSVINLKIKAIEENVDNYATEVTNLTEHIIGAETDPLIYVNMVNKAGNLLELSSLLNLEILNTSNQYTSKFLKELDMMLTTKVNDVFKYTLGSSMSLDSFVNDMAELAQYVETGMNDAELATKYKYMLNKLFESLKADVKDTEGLFSDVDIEGATKVKITYIPSKVTICNITSPTITMPLDNIELGEVLAVNEISHPVLYKLIDKIFNETIFSKGTVLTLTTEHGTYNVRSSTLGYCTVVKV